MRIIALMGLAASVWLTSAGAWGETAQQARMKSCNAEAGQQSLAGDARKAFMKSCLSGASNKASTPQQRMKDCNAEASGKGMQGDARKAFMKSCLSSGTGR